MSKKHSSIKSIKLIPVSCVHSKCCNWNCLFYFAGGPYAAFGGRDASRGLATFNVTSSDTEEYDDLSDLDTMEMESVREWEMQFKGEHIFGNFWNSIPNLVGYNLIWIFLQCRKIRIRWPFVATRRRTKQLLRWRRWIQWIGKSE